MSTPLEREAYKLLQTYKDEVDTLRSYWRVTPGDLASGRVIFAADPEVQVAVIRATLLHPPRAWHAEHALLSQLARRNLPYTPEDIHAILSAIGKENGLYSTRMPVQALLRALARPLADPDTLEACRADLEATRASVSVWHDSVEQRKLLKFIDELLRVQEESPVVYSDEWGDQVRPLLDEMDAGVRERWVALLRQCAASKSSAPNAKWTAATLPPLDALGKEAFTRLAISWLGAFRKSGNKPPEHDRETYDLVSNGCLLVEENGDLLRGLAWACAGIEGRQPRRRSGRHRHRGIPQDHWCRSALGQGGWSLRLRAQEHAGPAWRGTARTGPPECETADLPQGHRARAG